MIAHPLKTVFVHIPKTAGQSVEQVFLSYLGLDQHSRSALLLREKRDYESGPPRLSHLTAREYTSCGYLSDQEFNDYFSFTFVRNPWSRVRSFYLYLKFDETMSFDQFVLNELDTQIREEKYGWFLKPQVDFILDDNGHCLVDFVGRFERLQQDFNIITQRLTLPTIELPVMNASTAMSKGALASGYSCASKDKVAELYARDIEEFGYQYE